MNLLLLQENKVLRAENERKKKKKKKKARTHGSLGTDLFISVQEGRERIQQLDIQDEAQVEEPISRPRKRAPQRCSGCGTIGHTIRGCPSK